MLACFQNTKLANTVNSIFTETEITAPFIDSPSLLTKYSITQAIRKNKVKTSKNDGQARAGFAFWVPSPLVITYFTRTDIQ